MIKMIQIRFHTLGFLACMKIFMLSFGQLLSKTLPLKCYSAKWIPFHVMWFYQSFLTSVCIIMPIIAMDLLLMTFISLTHIQFKMLNLEIDRVFRRSERAKKSEIARLVDHHNFLIDFSNRINNTFSTMLLAYIFVFVISMCVEMYKSSANPSFSVFMNAVTYLSAAVFGLIFLFCIPGQNLTDEANNIPNAVYFTDWYRDSKQSTSVLMMISNGQRDISIKAGEVIKINLATSLSTIKTLLSYFMFLRTVVLDE
uniref:Odorant receptor OR5 n=1 Tax=Colaphellus bowringi TaxID=561076 RepID=A0A0S3J3E0_9CUCU|nr:odorant receptor OR5 [Colaphellus bowringi]